MEVNSSVFEVWEDASEHILPVNLHVLFSTFVSKKTQCNLIFTTCKLAVLTKEP